MKPLHISLFFLSLFLFSCPKSPEWGVVIRNAKIIDGMGRAAITADIRIYRGKILDIGEITGGEKDTIIDAEGLVLTPGFIDTHSHHDWDEDSTRLAAISQGITTIIVGQDGGSMAPLQERFQAYKANPLPINIAAYSGHNTIRREVMGEDFQREATLEEMEAMKELVRADMEAGALGLSTGLEYDPGIYSSAEEVIELAKIASEYGGKYISHMRSEDRYLEHSLDEILHIAEEANIPVQISHFKLARLGLWGHAGQILSKLDSAREAGLDVTADIYPYTHWQSTMTVLFPERNFTDPNAAQYALTELTSPEGMIISSYEPNPNFVGMTLAEIALSRNETPINTYMWLIAESRAKGLGESIIAKSMSEEDIQKILQWPHTNVCSDGSGDSRHPRGWGSFPRILKKYVREDQVLSLEEAIHKMTHLSAKHVGIQNRGVIERGVPADLVLLDPNRVGDKATFDEPHLMSEGIEKVWVNGRLVFDEGKATGEMSGEVLNK